MSGSLLALMVNLHMPGEVSLPGECLVTVGTLKRPLASVERVCVARREGREKVAVQPGEEHGNRFLLFWNLFTSLYIRAASLYACEAIFLVPAPRSTSESLITISYSLELPSFLL